jgi:hypothetical protein
MLNKKNNIQDRNDDTTKNWSVGRLGAFNSRWGALLVPLIFGYPIFVGFDSPIAIKTLALLSIWWFVLAIFWILPVFSYFDAERNWISNYRKSKAPCLKKQAVTVGFYFVYWPILTPKEILFWCIFSIVIIIYFISD